MRSVFWPTALDLGVEAACDREQRGGFERLRSRASRSRSGSRFTIGRPRISARSPMNWPLTWTFPDAPLSLPRSCCNAGRASATAALFRFFACRVASARYGQERMRSRWKARSSNARLPVALTDTRQLGIATLGTLRDHPRITRFRDFLKGWYLSYFHAGCRARPAGRRPAAASECAWRQPGQCRAVHAAGTQGSF